MAEYIERTDLRKTLKEEMQILKETPGKDDWDKGLMQGIKESIMHLNAAPSADVVEVVRCKECVRRNQSADLSDSVLCTWLHKLSMPKDGFCSYGEREDTNETD